MQGSGLETLISAAFGGVNSIKGSWKTMGACVARIQDGSSILLQSFLQTGFKTWEEICIPGEGTALSN